MFGVAKEVDSFGAGNCLKFALDLCLRSHCNAKYPRQIPISPPDTATPAVTPIRVELAASAFIG